MPDDNKAKKIIKGILEGGYEAVKDSAKQIKDTVSPTALIEQALGTKQPKNDEFSDFLKNSGPNLSPEELEKKKKELGSSDQKAIEEARAKLKAAFPEHMRPPQRQPKLSAFEEAKQEEERKKAMAIEMQKKQQQQTMVAPAGKQQRGSLFAKKKRPQSAGFETSKNIKVG